jgi:hypothetical protein
MNAVFFFFIKLQKCTAFIKQTSITLFLDAVYTGVMEKINIKAIKQFKKDGENV